MEPSILVALITQIGVILCSLLVIYTKSKLKLWERRGEDREKQRRNYTKLLDGYGRLYDEYQEIFNLGQMLGKEKDSNGIEAKTVPANVILYNLTNRTQLLNVITTLETESGNRRSDEED